MVVLAGHALFVPSVSSSREQALAERVDVLTRTRKDALDVQVAEMRRVERDLHDGAQARLVSLGMSLGMADELLDSDPDEARRLLAEARTAAGDALGDLRALVRGILPPVLADRGLAGAVQALVLASPVPVEMAVELPAERLPAPVESAAYFAVAEAITNVIKHSGARTAWVRVRHADGLLSMVVGDDGRGGADPDQGERSAGNRTPPGGLRRHGADLEPVRWADGRDHGGAVRAVIAEDLALLRDGLIRLLNAHDIEVVAAVGDGPSVLGALLDHRPDVAVLDVRLPPTFTNEGLLAAIEARKQMPGLPILVLSQYVEPLYARELLSDQRGGVGYLLKDRVMDVGQFVDAVRRVAAGGTVMDPEVVSQLLAKRARDEPLGRLTPREREVLALMAEGRSNAAVAAGLVVSEKAVSKHIANIFMKLDLPPSDDDNRRVLAVLAYLNS